MSRKVFINGPISAQFVAESIEKHNSKKDIGAHNIFLGQVRADIIDGKKVKAIDYSAYTGMADKEFDRIRESAFKKFDIKCMHIYHSIGIVNAGEISIFVFVSSGHRDMSYQASRYVVEEIKANVPIFGKEIFKDETYTWKENK